MKISEHFNLEEFIDSPTAVRHGISNEPTQTVINNICGLVEQVLEPARRKWGAPIFVNSGYRCNALNTVVGGAKKSQHLTGQAADITTGSRDKNKILFNIIKHYFPFDQLINESDYAWIHVSFSLYGNNRHQVLDL